MGKKGTERRTYSKEFKVEAAALAEKQEKPISQFAVDLRLNESVLRRWMQQAREGAGETVSKVPATGYNTQGEGEKGHGIHQRGKPRTDNNAAGLHR